MCDQQLPKLPLQAGCLVERPVANSGVTLIAGNVDVSQPKDTKKAEIHSNSMNFHHVLRRNTCDICASENIPGDLLNYINGHLPVIWKPPPSNPVVDWQPQHDGQQPKLCRTANLQEHLTRNRVDHTAVCYCTKASANDDMTKTIYNMSMSTI